MSNRAVKFALVEPMIARGPARTEAHYPRAAVMWSVLAFSLTAWAIVILAVRHFV